MKSTDPYATKTMQERYRAVKKEIKQGKKLEELSDKKFVEMDLKEGMKPKT